LEQGHLHHPETGFNPGTGEQEDTDVGFPGPEHHIAERDWAMKLPMSILAFGAIVGGVLQIPGVDASLSRFLEPTFATSRLAHLDPSTGSAWFGLIIGAVIGLAGITVAYRIWVVNPAFAVRLRERLPAVHTFLYRKWYFDELIEFAVVRPAQWLGRFTESVLERGVISGGITGSSTGIVRAASAAVRRGQTGFVRYYVALMIVGIGCVALYFLIEAT
jgi:NADH-quinone oxidoreductase subunit L